MLSSNLNITAYEELAESYRVAEARLRLALQNAHFIIAHSDCPLRYTWVHNPHTDFDPAQIPGKTDLELEDSAGTRSLYALKNQALRTGTPVRDTVEFLRSEGPRTYDISVEPMRNAAAASTSRHIRETRVSISPTENGHVRSALRGNRRISE